MVILGGWERIYSYLNNKNTELFRGYKIGTATGKLRGLLFSSCTVDRRLFFSVFLVVILGPLSPEGFLGDAKSFHVILCLTLTRMIMLRPYILRFLILKKYFYLIVSNSA